MGRKLVISKDDVIRMKTLKEVGYTNKQIAEIFNIAKTTVWDYLHNRWGGFG